MSTTIKAIPQTDPKANYLAHKAEIDAAIHRVLDSGWYILGQEVTAFEQEFAAYIGVQHALGVANGTDALELALRACGVGVGDAVFTVSHTAVATVAAIELTGATPILVDIEPKTYTIDPNQLEHVIKHVMQEGSSNGCRPKAIIPVHLYGHSADMPAILDIARRYNLYVIEDCAQSHGGTLAGRKTGAWGDIAAFSFYPTKNLGALGDGGAIVTDNDQLAEQVRLLRQYGWRERYVSDIAGANSRLDELQAALLRVKLRYLEQENSHRRELAQIYSNLLADSGLILPTCQPQAEHVYHQYVVRTSHRDELRHHLAELNIRTGIHYPVPVHEQPAYRERHLQIMPLHHTEQIARQILSLPMYPQLHKKEVRWVSEQIVSWAGQV